MTSEAMKVFRAHWLVKAFPLAAMAVAVYALLFLPGEKTLTAILYFGFGFLWIAFLAVYILTTKVVFTGEAVQGENLLLGPYMVRYEEIERLESAHLYFIVQVYRVSETKPALSIGIGYEGLQEMLTELVERAPDDVEIVDPMGRLSSIVEHDVEE